jgi:predicted amidohydrolase
MNPPGLSVAVAAGPAPTASAAAAAAAAGADLLVLPRRPDAAAEASDGNVAHAMGELAARHRLAILFAYLEACSGLVHLALQLVLPDGRSTANYRATHLGSAAAGLGWTPGNWLTMTRLEPLTLGLLAGLDPLAPEVGRALSGRGAEALIGVADPSLTPAVLAGGENGPWLVRLRAIENAVPVCLVGADGCVAAAAGSGEALPVATRDGLDLLTLERNERLPVVPRRPDLYRQLVDGAAD